MWNDKAPLELLKHMPHDLTQQNLDEIQKVINDDKYINSMRYGRDLCGEYAPFCKNCLKVTMTPCANAYVRMKIAEGMDYAIVSDNKVQDSQKEVEAEPVTATRPEENAADDAACEEPVTEEAVPAEEVVSEETQTQEVSEEQTQSADNAEVKPEDVGIKPPTLDALTYEKPLQLSVEERLRIEEQSAAAKAENGGSGKKIRIAIARRRKS